MAPTGTLILLALCLVAIPQPTLQSSNKRTKSYLTGRRNPPTQPPTPSEPVAGPSSSAPQRPRTQLRPQSPQSSRPEPPRPSRHGSIRRDRKPHPFPETRSNRGEPTRDGKEQKRPASTKATKKTDDGASGSSGFFGPAGTSAGSAPNEAPPPLPPKVSWNPLKSLWPKKGGPPMAEPSPSVASPTPARQPSSKRPRPEQPRPSRSGSVTRRDSTSYNRRPDGEPSSSSGQKSEKNDSSTKRASSAWKIITKIPAELEICKICLGPMNNPESPTARLSCQDKFHLNCIGCWFCLGTDCPAGTKCPACPSDASHNVIGQAERDRLHEKVKKSDPDHLTHCDRLRKQLEDDVRAEEERKRKDKEDQQIWEDYYRLVNPDRDARRFVRTHIRQPDQSDRSNRSDRYDHESDFEYEFKDFN